MEKLISGLYCLEVKEHICRQGLVNVHDNNYQPQRRVSKFVGVLKFKEMLFQMRVTLVGECVHKQ